MLQSIKILILLILLFPCHAFGASNNWDEMIWDEDKWDFTSYNNIVLNNSKPNVTIKADTAVQVYGTVARNIITLEKGANAKLINFPGNNIINIQSDSTLFTVARSGATVIFNGADSTVLKIPVTKSLQTINFYDKSLELVIDQNQVKLGKQLISSTKRAVGDIISTKVENRPTIPVFYPWAESNNCDTDETPYSLMWTSVGQAKDIESLQHNVSNEQKDHMENDTNTLYLISEDWNYWICKWRYLSPNSQFYLDELFEYHNKDGEYGETKVINFTNPEWTSILAQKALNFKNAGFDGMILDWWNNAAGNGRSDWLVERTRLNIAKAIREKVGNEFILMGNVNWHINDPTVKYLSGVFLELYKAKNAEYPVSSIEQNKESIEQMEQIIEYWNTYLQYPKIIAFEPWKITTSEDSTSDRNTPKNYKYAKLFTAMVLVIADNGYILYADNNDDSDLNDHKHAYYDFYHTDLGKAVSNRVVLKEGVSYKEYEKGVIVYNRNSESADIKLPNGENINIQSLEGLFIQN